MSSAQAKADWLAGNETSDGQSAYDIAPEESERVKAITAECHAEDYWFAASRDGNRESHYRGKMASMNPRPRVP